MIHTPPEGFVRELRSRFPDFLELRWNDTVARWELITVSSMNKPVSQFWGWYRNPLTNEKIEADPVTGLVPYRGLEPEAQAEIIDNLTRTFLGNRHDGAGTYKRQFAQAKQHNDGILRKSAQKRGEQFADLIKEMDLRRPWLKHHGKTPRGRRIQDLIA